jgi:hypothetical protein
MGSSHGRFSMVQSRTSLPHSYRIRVDQCRGVAEEGSPNQTRTELVS